MAYHIFEINAFKQLQFVQTEQTYREAKSVVRNLRKNETLAAGTSYRMMFAATAEHAERLLKEKREARPMGEDD